MLCSVVKTCTVSTTHGICISCHSDNFHMTCFRICWCISSTSRLFKASWAKSFLSIWSTLLTENTSWGGKKQMIMTSMVRTVITVMYWIYCIGNFSVHNRYITFVSSTHLQYSSNTSRYFPTLGGGSLHFHITRHNYSREEGRCVLTRDREHTKFYTRERS